jgi:hypothetical protein
LQIEHRVRRVSLAEKCLLWLQLDNRSAEPSLCKKGGGIEWNAVIARQNATSLQVFVLGGLFMPREASPLRATFGDYGEWIKGRERSARGNKGHFSLCDLTPATQARISPWGTCAKWEKHPVINRNYDQSLSIIAWNQESWMVNSALSQRSVRKLHEIGVTGAE